MFSLDKKLSRESFWGLVGTKVLTASEAIGAPSSGTRSLIELEFDEIDKLSIEEQFNYYKRLSEVRKAENIALKKKEKEVRRLELRCAQLEAALTHDKITEIDLKVE